MIKVEVTRVLPFPVPQVFDAASDPQQQLRWDAGTLKSVQKLSDGPLAQGSRYRGRIKGMGEVDYEYGEFERPRVFSHVATNRMGRSSHVFQLEPAGNETTLIQTGTLEPAGIGKLMAPMAKLMFRRRFNSIAKELERYLAAGRARSGEETH